MKEKNQIYKCTVCGYLLSEISSEIPDHCPGCLSGIHETDAEGEVCGGMLEPVAIWVKGDESFEIIQRCRLCGEMTSVEMTERQPDQGTFHCLKAPVIPAVSCGEAGGTNQDHGRQR